MDNVKKGINQPLLCLSVSCGVKYKAFSCVFFYFAMLWGKIRSVEGFLFFFSFHGWVCREELLQFGLN